MTKLSADWFPEVIPDFDPWALKEQVQADILEDTEGMTDEDVCEYFQLASEQMALLRKVYARRIAEAAKEQEVNANEEKNVPARSCVHLVSLRLTFTTSNHTPCPAKNLAQIGSWN